MYNFFAYIARMKYITRWSLMRNSLPENIQEHSHMAAVLAHALAVIRRDVFLIPCDPDKCASAALFHDAAEIFTGDLPTPIKYYSPAILDAYRQVEAVAANRLREEDPDIHALVKAADKLCAYLKCLEELQSGNQEFADAARQTLASLRDMNMPEIDWFLERFAPAFGLTLDGLQGR